MSPYKDWFNPTVTWTSTVGSDGTNSGGLIRSNVTGTSTLLRNSLIGGSDVSLTASSSYSANASANNMQTVGTMTPSTEVTQDMFSLGAGFGKQTDFKTTTVTFEKDAILATLVVFYDDKKGLQARGIEIAKPKVIKEEPNPFPNSKLGCTPPKNWK
jgi:hypothetical protein